MRDEELQAFLDGARADDAAHTRARQRWLQQQAAEEATLGGLLRGFVGPARALALQLSNTRIHRGWLRVVGDDYCCLETPDGRFVYVALSAIDAVRMQRTAKDAARSGRPLVPPSARLVDVLSWLVEDRPEVALGLRAQSQPLHGRLVTVGQDVVLIRAADWTYVPVVAITDAAVRSRQE